MFIDNTIIKWISPVAIESFSSVRRLYPFCHGRRVSSKCCPARFLVCGLQRQLWAIFLSFMTWLGSFSSTPAGFHANFPTWLSIIIVTAAPSDFSFRSRWSLSAYFFRFLQEVSSSFQRFQPLLPWVRIAGKVEYNLDLPFRTFPQAAWWSFLAILFDSFLLCAWCVRLVNFRFYPSDLEDLPIWFALYSQFGPQAWPFLQGICALPPQQLYGSDFVTATRQIAFRCRPCETQVLLWLTSCCPSRS